MNKKNVCLTIHSLASSGGEERMCTVLANALIHRDYNVIVVTLNQCEKEKTTFKLEKSIKRYTCVKNNIERKLFSYSFLKKIPLIRYKHILDKHKVDVIIDVDIHQSLVTTKVTKGTAIKVISWDHFNYERFAIRWSHDIMLDCFNSGEVDKLVVLTETDKKNFIEKEHLPKHFVECIYNPSPLQSDGFISHKEKKVLSVGRLTEQKGFDLLLKAWNLVEKEIGDWQLEIVGSGVDEGKLKEMIKELHLSNVTISPFTDDIKSKYANASIYCLPSRTEGFGLVVVEAATMSVPSVAFACGGPEEIICDGENGFLVERENHRMMAEKMIVLMRNKKLREQMSNNCYEWAKKFQIENIIENWTRLIEAL